MNAPPYLSIVGWARNDGYTPNYAKRLEHSLGLLVRQLDKYRIPSEVIVVEWNPPPENALLADELDGFLGKTSHASVRFIVVPPQFHRGPKGWQKRGMHVNHAANVGFRRARGRFVTPKALDTFYSEKLVATIGRQDLDERRVYRCDRLDARMEDETWLDLPDDELLAALARHVVLRNDRLTHSIDWKMRDLHTNACGDFILMTTKRWHEIRGYQKDPTVLCLDSDSIALHAAAAHGASEVHWQDECIYKVVHGNTHAQRVTTIWKDWQLKLDHYLILRHRRELAMNLRIWLNYPRRRVRGLEEILAPSIERHFVAKAARYAKNDTSLVTNDANWGLARETLTERTVARAAWDTP